jgi:competence protein ComEC
MGMRARRLPASTAWAQIGRLQRPRVILLAPIAMMLGAAWHLSVPFEPSAIAIAICCVGFAAAAVATAFWPTAKLSSFAHGVRLAVAFGLMLASAAAVGAGAAQLKAASRPDVSLSAPVEASVTGLIEARDRSGGRLRFTLAVTGFEAADYAGPRPRRVRVSLREDQARFLTPGRAVTCRARLAPASPPLVPGAYDFERRAFFDGLDGVGFALGACRAVPDAAAPSFWQRAPLWLAAVRADIAAAIVAEAPSQGGALAAAMIVGDRSFMSEEATRTLQDAGLAHIISVSGMHMAVVGGFVFFLLKRGLALWGWLAVRAPVSKIAAVGALLALGVYLALSGSSVPAQRAAVMAAVAFGAVLVDRPPVSMRGLGLAACLIVLMSPQAVVEPGFQMSFAATLALVAAYEMLARRDGPIGSPGPLIGGLQAAGRAMTGAVATSAVAGAATEIFAIQHFQRLTLYGLPVNLAAAPVITFVVAPCAVAAGVAAPFGLAGPPLQLTAAALDGILALAQGFAERPEAVQGIAPLAPWAFGLAVAGLVWACLWRGLLRVGAGVFVTGAIAAQALSGPPVLVFDAGLRHIYATPADGPVLALFPEQQRRFERERLLAQLGAWPRDPRQGVVWPGCAGEAGVAGCTVPLRGGTRLAVVAAPEVFTGPCPAADLVLSPLVAPADWGQRCPDRILLDAHAHQGRAGIVRQGLRGFDVRYLNVTAPRPWRLNAVSGITPDE